MKPEKLLGLLLFYVFWGVSGQQLHTQSNAASISNESNSTTGWTGSAIISSDAVNPQLGNFSIRAVSTASNGRILSYTFGATIGQDYAIRIWAKAGPQVSSPASPAFADWSGFSGFSTTPIVGTAWSEYVFNVTATTSAPIIRIYVGNYASRFTAGNTVNIDNVSILPAGGGGDVQAPTVPTNLAASNTTSTGTTLNWTASTDNVGVTGYTVFQDGTNIGTTAGATNFNVTGLTASMTYAFTVRASDAAGNTSAASNTANVTTSAGADTQAPTAPTNLTASNTTSSGTTLNWTASTDNVGVTGYTVFQDGTNMGTTAGATNFNVTGLIASTTYAFTVRARDAAGNISAASNTVSVTTPGGGGGVTDYTSANSNLATVDWQGRDLMAARNVGIGTTNTQGYRLAVAGTMVAEGVTVKLQTNWPDYVFEKSFNLPSLEEVEGHIREYGYLENMPSASEVGQSGIELGQMNAKLLQKIEELTLYTIQQEKKIEQLQDDNKKIELISQRLLDLEKQLKK